MAYQIQRKHRITDTLELLDESGKTCHSLPIDLDFDQTYSRLNKARGAVVAAENVLKSEDTESARESYGSAVCTLLEVIFGEAGAETLVAHYEGRYFELIVDVFPFIIENLYPRLNAIAAQKIDQMRDLRSRIDRNRGKFGRK